MLLLPLLTFCTHLDHRMPSVLRQSAAEYVVIKGCILVSKCQFLLEILHHIVILGWHDQLLCVDATIGIFCTDNQDTPTCSPPALDKSDLKR